LILPIEPPQAIAEHRLSVRCGRRSRQFREQGCMAPQPPPVHSFDAVEASRGVGFWKAPVAQLSRPRLEISHS